MEFKFKRLIIAFVVRGLPRHTIVSQSFWSCVHGCLRTERTRQCFSSSWLRITSTFLKGMALLFVVTLLKKVIAMTSVKPLLHAVIRFSSFVPFLDVEIHTGPLGCEKGSSSSYESEWIPFLPKPKGGDKLAKCCWVLCGCR